jgi:transposase
MALTFALSPGQAHDAPEGRKLLHRVGRMPRLIHLLMDRAYEGDATRQLAMDVGMLLWCRPSKIDSRHGNTIEPCIRDAMR